MKVLLPIILLLILFNLPSNLTFAAAGDSAVVQTFDTIGTVSMPMSTVHAGISDDEGMAVGMRSNGMIYVVIGVLLIIFAGLILFLISLERKIRKLEKEETVPVNSKRKSI